MITILSGENRELMDFYLKRMMADEVLPTTQYNYQKDDHEMIFADLGSFSLFDEKRRIVIDKAAFLGAGKEKLNPAFLDVQPDVELVLCWDGKLSSKKDLKPLMNQAKVISCPMMSEDSKKELLEDLIKQKGAHVHQRDFNWLRARIDDNPFVMEQEIEKIALLEKPDRQMMDQILVPSREKDVFALSKAFYNRDLQEFLRLFRKFRMQNMEPLAIIALLASQIRFLFQVRVLSRTKDQEEIAAHMGVKKGRIYYALRDAKRFSSAQLLSSLNLLAQIEQQIKQGTLSEANLLEARIIELFQ